MFQEREELQVPLLDVEAGEGEIHSEHAASSPVEADVEQGFQAGSDAEGQSNKSEEDNAIELVRSLLVCWDASLDQAPVL